MGMPQHLFERVAQLDEHKAADRTGALLRLARYLQPYWPYLVLLLVAVVVGAGAMAAGPFLVAQAIDQFIGAGDRSGLARTMWLLIAVSAVVTVTFAGQFYLMGWIGQEVLARLRREIFAKTQSLSLSYFDRHEAGDLMSRLVNDVDMLNQFLSQGLIQFVGGLFQMAAIVVVMLALNWRLSLASLSVVPPMLLVTSYLSRRARRAFRESRAALGDISAELEEGISGARVAQAFNRAETNRERFVRLNQANRDANVGAVGITSAFSPAMETLNALATAIVIGYGGFLALAGTLTVGLVFGFLQYVQQFFRPVQQISQIWGLAQAALAGADRIFELLDEPLDLVDRPGARPMPPIAGRVVFADVSFAYNPDEPILTGVSLVVEPGQSVAIVGPTGAGKTTLVNLLTRFYDVTSGAITIDGLDVRDVEQASLRQQIGLVLQDSFLFSASITDNIRYGRLDAAEAEVVEAAKTVGVHSFISQLPEGYQTQLGERGGTLSQGQRQLISFARAVLADPRILILDEATSSVDTRTEVLIQQALKRLLAGRTSFVIAHRLSTIRDADQVLVMEQGRIVERAERADGRSAHELLLDRGGAYAQLYARQFRDLAPAANGGNGQSQPVATE